MIVLYCRSAKLLWNNPIHLKYKSLYKSFGKQEKFVFPIDYKSWQSMAADPQFAVRTLALRHTMNIKGSFLSTSWVSEPRRTHAKLL